MPHWFGGVPFTGQVLEGFTCLPFGAVGREPYFFREEGGKKGRPGAPETWWAEPREVTAALWLFPREFWPVVEIDHWKMTVAMDTYWFNLSSKLPVYRNHLSLVLSTWFSWPCPPGHTWLSQCQHLTKPDQWISSWCFLTLNQREHLVTLSLRLLKRPNGKLRSCWQPPYPLHGKSRPSTRKIHMPRERETARLCRAWS